PDKIAVDDLTHRLGYADLDGAAGRWAGLLAARGVRRGDVVGVCLRPGAAALAVLYGVWRAGAAYLPLDPAYPPERLAFMARDAGAVAVVAQPDAPDELRQAVGRVIDGDRAPTEPAGFPAVAVTPNDTAYLIYTSGSTGRPKGVAVSHGALANLLDGMARTTGARQQDMMMSTSAWSFDMSVPELFLPAAVGASVVVAPRAAVSDGIEMLRLIRRTGTTWMQATPSAWRMLLDAGLERGEVSTAICGAERMPVPLAADLLATAETVWNFYGPTETAVWATAARVTEPEHARLIGRPLPGVTVAVLTAQGLPVPRGAIGELRVGGHGVAQGYHDRPTLTAERFPPDPHRPGGRVYRTGDLVRLRADGEYEFAGRADDQMKVRGYRIEPGEVEDAVLGSGTVRSVAVVTLAGQESSSLVAYLVPGDGFDVGELRALLRDRLPGQMVPTLVTIAALPRLPNGKVDRRALSARAVTGPSAGVAFAPAEGPREEAFAALWSEVLGVTRVGRHDNFFALGGDSMRALRIAQRAAGQGLTIEPADVFTYQTVAELASAAGRPGTWEETPPPQAQVSAADLRKVRALRARATQGE
ncbi:non-ribosomal peptide synthetase, partial [Nonomuraea sp. K271]